MLTPLGMEELMKEILSTGGMTEDMESLVKRLQDDFNERQVIIEKYGEAYDGEAREYDFVEKANEWEGRYRELEKRYRDKFFANSGTRNIDTRDTTILDETANEDTDVPLDDLLYRRED